MRIVLDTNSLIQCVAYRSAYRSVWLSVLSGQNTLCITNEILLEYEEILSKFFKPDKTKSTFLKRGDFGLEREIKPKIKVRVAPLRRVKNAGAKVVKKLVRRGNE